MINMNNINSIISTILGALVAVANAWITIDWDNFEWNRNTITKLVLSGLIALGGYMTSINKRKKKIQI